MARPPLIPVKGPNTEAPKVTPTTITITPEQVQGVQARTQAVNQANMDLNSFIGGIVTGHGYDAVQVTGFDPAKRTLTFVKARVDKSVDNG